MKTKNQTDAFHQFAVQKYGVGGTVSRNTLLAEMQNRLNVDLERATTLLFIMVGVNYFKEINDKLYIASISGEHFDNSLIKYWIEQ